MNRRPAWLGSGLIAALGTASLVWALVELLARAPDLSPRFGPEFAVVTGVAALSRRFGIALPGKGFASMVLGVCLYALMNLGWPAAVVATAIGVPAGDFFLRRLRLSTGLYTAAHIAVGTTVVGAVYEALGGAVGLEALRIPNLEALAAAVVLLPLLINGTFYVELAARGWFGRVDAKLVIRWELAVYVMAAALALAWTALVHATLPTGAVILFAASLVALGAGLWYVVRLGIHADELRLVQRLARALAADANLGTSFASIRRLTGRLVPWEHMGVARYVAETNEMELVEDTSLPHGAGVRYSADGGLTAEVLRRRRPLVANALTPHQVVAHGDETPGSEILIPLYQGESLVGLWSVRHSDPMIYRDSDGAVLHMLAPQLALSLALNGLVSPLIGASQELAAYFDRLAGTARELHTSAHQVTGSAARAEQGAVQATRFVATGSQRAVALAEATSEVAEAGAETMAQGQRMEQTALEVRASTQEAAHRLARLREAVAQGTSEMTRLRAAAQQVEEFSETIAGIANQTNLLALNATIEAARAGLHGRSFAVVAEEVGKLAHESSREAQNVARSVEETRRTLDRAAALLERLGSDMAAVVTTSGAWLDQLEAIVIAAERTAAVGRRIAELAGSNRSASSEIVAELTQAEAVAREAAQEVEAVARAAHQQLAAVERLTRGTSEISTLAAGMTRATQFIRGDGAS